MKIRIGKASDNDFVADHPYVSRYHAVLSRDESGSWTLEDCGSTNGTFVNGMQVMVKKHLASTDTVRLGDSFTFSLPDALKGNNDYSDAFAALQTVYHNYARDKVKIQSAGQFRARLLQSLPFAIPGIIGVVAGFLGKGSGALFAGSLLLVICAPVIGIYLAARQSAKVPEQLQQIADRFKTDYVCPKCGAFLGDVPWESLRNRKQCPLPGCKARWVNESAGL